MWESLHKLWAALCIMIDVSNRKVTLLVIDDVPFKKNTSEQLVPKFNNTETNPNLNKYNMSNRSNVYLDDIPTKNIPH